MKKNNFGHPDRDETDDQYDIRRNYGQMDGFDDDEFEAQDVRDSDYDWENDYTDENER